MRPADAPSTDIASPAPACASRPRRSPRLRRGLRFVGWLMLALAVLGVAASAALLRALAPNRSDEWQQALQVGPARVDVSLPTAWRLATHPLGLSLLQGRDWPTRHGRLHLSATDTPGQWLLRCAPCHLPLGDGDTLTLSALNLGLQRLGPDTWGGTFTARGGPAGAHTVPGRWSWRVEATGAVLQFQVSDVPLADAYALWHDLVPEVAQARIGGRLQLHGQLHLPSRSLQLQPTLTGMSVAGLGTESLLNTSSKQCASHLDKPLCRQLARTGSALGLARFGTWLPRAVLAAEDQRFYEHIGFDPVEMAAAWSQLEPESPVARPPAHPPAAGLAQGLRGASTLSQQVAKWLYTGSQRRSARKLRELLYAVELDRTLGKARVLSLYLSTAPWGAGQYGAEAAAQYYLGKSPAELSPREAAWLASLLHNPRWEQQRMARADPAHRARVDWVLRQMRPRPVGPPRRASTDLAKT